MRHFFDLISILSGIYLTATPAFAQSDRQQLGAVIDSLVTTRLAAYEIPGAVVAVVKDSGLWKMQGYGLAHIAGQRPVDGNTPFRVGELGQLLTAAAVLSLADRKLVDLQADIGIYLGDLQLRRSFRENITLHHLLTHTAGFDDGIPRAVRDPENLRPLRELISANQPPQVHPPGQLYHYSPFHYSLAGYIVEQVTKMPFDRAMEEMVFQPLGMTYSTFAQPPSTAIDAQLAAGYTGRKLRIAGPDYSLFAPADGLIATGGNMAAFLLSQLGTGDSLLTREGRILQLSQQYTANPSPTGMTYGYQEEFDHGQRVLALRGNAPGYSASLLLLPGLQLGLFVATNKEDQRLHAEVWEAVLDFFFAGRASFDVDLQPNRLYLPVNGSRYAGHYRRADYPHQSFLRAPYLLGWAGEERLVRPGDVGALLIDGRRMVITAPDLFTDPQQGVVSMGFRLPRIGKATHLTAGRAVYERIRWWERPPLLWLILITSAVLALGSGWGWPVYRWATGGAASRSEKLPPRLWRVLVTGASLAWLAGLAAAAVYLSLAVDHPVLVRYGPDAEMLFVLTLVLIAVLGAIVFPAAAPLAWRKGWWALPTRLLLTLQALVMMLAILVLNHLHLIGFRF